jgi:hypothetical protein
MGELGFDSWQEQKLYCEASLSLCNELWGLLPLGMKLTTHFHLGPKVKKEWSCTWIPISMAQCISNIVTNEIVQKVNGDYIRFWKVGCGWFQALSWHSLGKSEKNYDNPAEGTRNLLKCETNVSDISSVSIIRVDQLRWWKPRRSLKHWFLVQQWHGWSPNKILTHLFTESLKSHMLVICQ